MDVGTSLLSYLLDKMESPVFPKLVTISNVVGGNKITARRWEQDLSTEVGTSLRSYLFLPPTTQGSPPAYHTNTVFSKLVKFSRRLKVVKTASKSIL